MSSPFGTAMAMLDSVMFSPIVRKLTLCGVPDILEIGPMPAAAIAEKTGLDSLSLTRSLRALTSFGIFSEVAPGTFANNDASRLFRSQPGGLYHWTLFMTSDQVFKAAGALGHTLETGESAHDFAHGQRMWDYLREHPEDNEHFNFGLGEIRKDEQEHLAKAYDWSTVRSVVDVGGGAGHLLAASLQQNPAMRGILFDRTDVLPDAESTLTGLGVRDRCELVGGDFFQPIGVTGDVWILSQILHDWTDAEAKGILKQCRGAMSPNDRLLVVEMVPVPGKPDLNISILDVTMMMMFGEARQRTVAEYETLFAAAGLQLVRELPTGTAFSILEARPVS
jgi:hypothetical protein